ncbi:MAG: YicC/YloC family endoribonuclease [Flavobacteriales bacterium]
MKKTKGAILSMTGFGRATGSVGERQVNVEVRSLNSKGADLNIKLPLRYREKEMETRSKLAEWLERGKIDLYVSFEQDGESSFSINKNAFDQYHKQVKELYEKTGTSPEDIVSVILRLPDVVKADKGDCTDAEWKQLLGLIEKACEGLNQFRVNEGSKLESDLTERLDIINGLMLEIEALEKERVQTVKDRLNKAIEENNLKSSHDPNRFEQEMIYYLEKLDINEEKVRLRAHCKYFRDTMSNESGQGRKLNFITQEMGREINTLGSKANHAVIQNLVVQMKDELEKIKEQSLNIL